MRVFSQWSSILQKGNELVRYHMIVHLLDRLVIMPQFAAVELVISDGFDEIVLVDGKG